VSGRLQFRISGESALCGYVRCRGFDSFVHLAEHVRSLPYGRPANAEDPLAVLREGRGTCSAKHRFLATVAQDCGHSEVRLAVGIYEMSEENTPGVGNVLGPASLTSIPEAHCYLSIAGDRYDFTDLSAGSSSPFAALLAEYTVSDEPSSNQNRASQAGHCRLGGRTRYFPRGGVGHAGSLHRGVGHQVLSRASILVGIGGNRWIE
jgi:hypothetical protein